jgi:hypothetical protein
MTAHLPEDVGRGVDVRCADFPATYRVLEGEATIDGPRLQELRASEALETGPGLDVMVSDAGGRSWLARFYGRRDDPSLLAHTPSPDHLLVVAGGIPYWVPAEEPTAFRVLGFQPVRSVHCAPGVGLLVLEGCTSLAAIGDYGQVVWRSPRLVSDGFAEVRLTSADVWIRGYSAPDHGDVERRLDLASGAIS